MLRMLHRGAHQGVDQGHDTTEALVGNAAGQEDVKGQACSPLRHQRGVLCADWQHSGAAIGHLHRE